MKIWLMTIGEPVPISDAVGHRLHRTGQFADALSKIGHQVTWWASAFDHRSKTHLVHEYTTISKSDNYDIVLLKGCGYRRNISIQRIWDELQLASEFKRSSPNMIKPDIIVCSVPSIALAIAAVEYGKKNRIPVVLDGRDMWPDIFVEVLPTSLRWLGKIAVTPIEARCRWAFKHATAILGITDEFVNWGLKKAGRVRTSFDTAIPFAYSLTQQSQSKIAVAEQYWDSMGVRDNDDVFNVLFIGMIANTLDVDAILDASQDPRIKALNIRFIIAGDGDKLHHYKKLSSTYTNVVWPGWIDAAQIQVVMQRSHVGIDPMPCRFDFLATVNNKAVEYLCGGLPIISSPDYGVLADLLRETGSGLSYGANSGVQLADKILQLYADRDQVAIMSNNAEAVYIEHFEYAKVMASFENYLKKVVDNRAALADGE